MAYNLPRTSIIRKSAALIGAGISGATAASAFALAGRSVHVFDKARWPGGRLTLSFMFLATA